MCNCGHPAISDSGKCGVCISGLREEPRPTPFFHGSESCAGMLVAEQLGPRSFALRCEECGAREGYVTPALIDQILARTALAAVAA